LTSAVGVVIATRDRAESLRVTLNRLRALPERPPIVVVDNGSCDETAAIVRRAGGDIQLIELDRDIGPAARTLGVRALHTDAVAFCDDDSWWEPGSLARAGELLSTHPQLGLIAARILVGPVNRLDPSCAEMANSPLPGRPGMPGRSVLGFIACAAVVRKSAYLEVGGFDRRMGFGGEESLLSLDLATAGWHLSYIPEIVAHHHPWPDPRGRKRRTNEVRNALWVTWLRRPLGSLIARTAAISASSLRAGEPQAIADAARGLPWVLRERRALQPDLERAARLVSRGVER
jgi:GT2 family glycosyltransferase